jgi:tRNA (cytidine/uridine-2'-O-)-methyltransferase
MFHIALFQPEIPPNTGNIIRLCANTHTALHLIHPLGFAIDDARLRRAGLDYHEYARVHEHRDLAAFMEAMAPSRVFACSTRGDALYTDIAYLPGDVFLFGPETRGLPAEVLSRQPRERIIRIPMVPQCRSLNLSNAVAVIVYEAWRQRWFEFGV